MLRMATPDYLRFPQARIFTATFGGGEANAAVSLTNFCIPTAFEPACLTTTSPARALPLHRFNQVTVDEVEKFASGRVARRTYSTYSRAVIQLQLQLQ
jgi:hypothetical protein